jgi:hypothetical protein
MKPLKRKVIIVSLSLSTFLVMGTAYAYSEASAPLQMWFKSQLSINQQAIDRQLQQDMVTASQALDESNEKLVASVGVHLEKVTEDASYTLARSIDATQQSYSDQLERAAAALSKSSLTGFDIYIDASTKQMSSDIEQWADEMIQGLTAELGD